MTLFDLEGEQITAHTLRPRPPPMTEREGGESATTKELSFSCFYALSGDVSVRVSEDLATAYHYFFSALYKYYQAYFRTHSRYLHAPWSGLLVTLSQTQNLKNLLKMEKGVYLLTRQKRM